jgi:hypothetical protein
MIPKLVPDGRTFCQDSGTVLAGRSGHRDPYNISYEPDRAAQRRDQAPHRRGRRPLERGRRRRVIGTQCQLRISIDCCLCAFGCSGIKDELGKWIAAGDQSDALAVHLVA